MIPNVIVYVEHSLLEFEESQNSSEQGMVNKSTRQLGEGYLFRSGSNRLCRYNNFDIR